MKSFQKVVTGIDLRTRPLVIVQCLSTLVNNGGQVKIRPEPLGVDPVGISSYARFWEMVLIS